jgi:hypothetical protein
MVSEYTMTTTDGLFGKISEQLSQYTTNGLLDTSMFFEEVRIIITKLDIAAYEMGEFIVTLEDYKTPLPCNFYMLDSAWLCDTNSVNSIDILQSNFIMYSETTKEVISQKYCNTNDQIVRDVISNGVVIQSTPCNNNNENVLDKITIKEYMEGGGNPITWKNPILLTLKSKKSIGQQVCTDKCKNLFARSPYEISIAQQGFNKFLYSNLEKPVIYLKYWLYPEDPVTGLPLIPDNPIILRAIEYHLMHYFFYMTWLNSNDVNIERKVQDLEMKRDKYLREAINYCLMPSFQKNIEMARRTRRRFNSYEIMSSRHL